MNRTLLQQLAEGRILDAQVLLNAGRWSAAYYLAGYAVECALKACIAKLTSAHDFPDKDFVVKSYTHRIEALLLLAGLKKQRDADSIANPVLRANWIIVKDWEENARYQQWTEPQARELCQAVMDSTTGVLPWIRVHW